MTTRLLWTDGYRDTEVVTQYGVRLRVKFLPGSRSWGVYRDGELMRKRATRDQAKHEALQWRYFRPSDSVPCTACHGIGRVRRAAPVSSPAPKETT